MRINFCKKIFYIMHSFAPFSYLKTCKLEFGSRLRKVAQSSVWLNSKLFSVVFTLFSFCAYFVFTLFSHHFHIVFTSFSLRFHFVFTLFSLHIVLTSHCLHFVFLSFSRRFHVVFTLFLRCFSYYVHLAFTLF